MSVMRQSVQQGAGSVVGTLCSWPGCEGLVAAGIVNGPYSAFSIRPGRLGMSPRGSENDEIGVIELACAGAEMAARAHRHIVAVTSPIRRLVPFFSPIGPTRV